MIFCMSPHCCNHVSSLLQPCVLIVTTMCPHCCNHVSSLFQPHVLIVTTIRPHCYNHTSSCCGDMYSCCSKCRRRKGRSVFRKSSRQSKRKVNALYDIYTLNEGTPKRLAAQKLRRWGFHPDRRCALPLVCDSLLIRCPGHEDDVFPALDFRDRFV